MSIPPGERRPRPRLRAIPPVWFFLSIGVMALLASTLPGRRVIFSPWNLWGVVPIVVGVGVAFVGQQQFRRRGTTIKPLHESSALVTDGVFTFSRNPMYTSMVSALVGIAVLLGVLTPFAVPIGFFVLIRYAFIAHEERMMAERFGDAYREYQQRVRRWL